MEVAKWIVAAVAVFNFGGYVADALIPFTAKQHIHNPRWPPYAKFHNGQTMLLGIGLGLFSLFLLFRTGSLTHLQFLFGRSRSLALFRGDASIPHFPGDRLERSRIYPRERIRSRDAS